MTELMIRHKGTETHFNEDDYTEYAIDGDSYQAMFNEAAAFAGNHPGYSVHCDSWASPDFAYFHAAVADYVHDAEAMAL